MRPYVLAIDMSSFKYDDFLRVLDIINRYSESVATSQKYPVLLRVQILCAVVYVCCTTFEDTCNYFKSLSALYDMLYGMYIIML